MRKVPKKFSEQKQAHVSTELAGMAQKVWSAYEV